MARLTTNTEGDGVLLHSHGIGRMEFVYLAEGIVSF